jgi:putative tryptophan/tyrosine transport system substrate-binding protein
VNRRALLAAVVSGLAGAAGARAPSSQVKRVGLLTGGSKGEGLAKGLAPHGFVRGKNLEIEARIADPSDYAQLSQHARELVRLRVDVLCGQMVGPVRALMEATRTIPIVCAGVGDPVGYGIAKSLRRPGMNVTGLSYGKPEVAEIQLALVRQLRPQVRRMLLIVPNDRVDVEVAERELFASAANARMTWEVARPKDVAAVDRAFETFRPGDADAAYVLLWADEARFARAIELAMRHRMVTFGGQESLPVERGMLMAYWLDFPDFLGRVAAVVAAMLRGADPAETPFELPDRTNFLINRRTAEAIGVRIPRELLIRATGIVG